jgi:hypothetical protein
MTAFMVKAMAPLRSMELKLAALKSDSGINAITTAETTQPSGSSLLSLGLAAVAVISIWLIYQTYRQHIGLAEGELRNRRGNQI